MTTTDPNPTSAGGLRRWAVSPGELAAAVVAANVKPTARSMLPKPDAAAASAASTPSALGTQSDVMAVLADPVGRLTVVLEAPGRVGRAAPSIYWSGIAGPFVLVVETRSGLDVEVLAKLNDVALWLDRSLLLTAMPASSTEHLFDLSMAGYAALLAVADAVEEARLSRLFHRVQGPAAALTVAAVQTALDTGLGSDHPDWAVSATRAVSPADLGLARNQLAAGLGELAGCGILQVNGDQVGITPGGVGIVAALERPVHTAGVARAAGAPDGSIGVAHLTVHRGASGIWFALWTALGDAPRCSLIQCSAARAATTLIDLIRTA